MKTSLVTVVGGNESAWGNPLLQTFTEALLHNTSKKISWPKLIKTALKGVTVLLEDIYTMNNGNVFSFAFFKSFMYTWECYQNDL